ncbi:MAG: bifunctional DNA-binding transcriptional regulator/O6-methylguanine-DNA methyltransferase Ada [Acidobacteriota bacterium]
MLNSETHSLQFSGRPTMPTSSQTSAARALDEERCWQAVLSRDRTQDGRFFFGVITTGVFCRPSCAARRPLRKNVRFFRTAPEAEREGLRSCLRCKPLDPIEDGRVAQMRELCDYIRANCDSGDPLTLAALSRRTELSATRLRRIFLEVVGVTPRQYVESCRFEVLKRGLREGDSVTDAIYEAGFSSSSRVYEQTDELLGMTPTDYRRGGQGVAVSYALVDTPVGRLIVAATDRGLCFVHFDTSNSKASEGNASEGGQGDEELVARLQRELPEAEIRETEASDSGQLAAWVAALNRHLAGRQPHLDLPVDVRATAFQQQVWGYLRSIPRGETRSYAEVATAIGKPKAVRAVASACAANRVAIAIPCHRVIRAGGELGGYRWGVERKARLLERERGS